jgi:PKD repeat protein
VDYITVNTEPNADFAGNPTSGCAPLTVQFTDKSTGCPSDPTLGKPTGWKWDFGDGGISTLQHPSHTYANVGTYNVTLTVTNNCGSDTATKTDYIKVADVNPTADFIGTPPIGCAPLTVNFNDTSTGGPTSWQWDFGDGGTSTLQHPSHTYASPGTYTVKLTVTNNCGADTAVKEQYIVVEKECDGCFADLDDNGKVDIVDVMSVAARWNSKLGDPRYDPKYDVNCDDKIDIVDVMLVAARWGIKEGDPGWDDCPPVHPDCATPTSNPFTSTPKLFVTSISPKNRVHVGQRISVEVRIQEAVDIGAVEFHFAPHQGFSVKNIEAGDFLKSTGNTVTLLKSKDASGATLGLFSFGKYQGASGSGTLFTVELEAQSEGSGVFALSSVKLTDKEGNLLPVEANSTIPFVVLPPPPQVSALLANYPNPFNPETWIPYQLSNDAEVNISIYDVSGRLIRKLDLGRKDAGFYLEKSDAAYWNGANDIGESVASGVYFYHLKAGDFQSMRKLLIMK